MPAGRPTLYDPKMCKQVFKLCLLGSTDKQIADILDVSEASLNNWKNDYPEFLESFRKGRVDADANVANSLYKRANGYKFKEKTYESTMITSVDRAGNLAQTPGVLVKVVHKEVMPDVGAQKMWLVNRQKGVWSDKTEVESKNTNINMNVEPTPEEAQKIKEMLDKSI
jgi:hypothetical protein